MEKIYKYRKYEAIAKTGISSIDNHHLKYIQQINDIVDILNGKKSKDLLLSIFHNILYYAETYFIDEELSYQKNNYSNLNEHKKQHREFVDKISYFIDAYNSQKEGVIVEMMKFLDRWYKEHIAKADHEAVEKFIIK